MRVPLCEFWINLLRLVPRQLTTSENKTQTYQHCGIRTKSSFIGRWQFIKLYRIITQ